MAAKGQIHLHQWKLSQSFVKRKRFCTCKREGSTWEFNIICRLQTPAHTHILYLFEIPVWCVSMSTATLSSVVGDGLSKFP